MTNTTVARTSDKSPTRPWRRSAAVIARVEELHGQGLKREAIAADLGMKVMTLGAALRRSGRPELWKAISTAPRPPFEPQRVLHLAAEMLATIDDDPAEDDDTDIAPAGRPVRGPGGVIRWVAA